MSTPLYQVSRPTLNDLIVAARQALPGLNAGALAAVVKAITEAEQELARDVAPPAELSRPRRK